MQPETAINSWRLWDGELRSEPVILGPLSGGLSNHSFLLDSDGHKMVLRLNGTDSLLPSTNRSSESGIWQAASDVGIAPPLLHVDDQNRFLISTYIDNSLPSRPPFDETSINQALGLLKRCHQLQVEASKIDYIRHIEQYWQRIENKAHTPNPSLNKQREPMKKLLEELMTSGTPTGLCHHDPVAANFVGNADHLYLIDWEYAAHGLPIMDYAALSFEWQIDDKKLLAQTNFEPELLSMAKSLYKYLCTLWEEVTE